VNREPRVRYSMYVCMYVRTYVLSMYACIYVCMYVCIHACVSHRSYKYKYEYEDDDVTRPYRFQLDLGNYFTGYSVLLTGTELTLAARTQAEVRRQQNATEIRCISIDKTMC
jgi:hypothetical protein